MKFDRNIRRVRLKQAKRADELAIKLLDAMEHEKDLAVVIMAVGSLLASLWIDEAEADDVTAIEAFRLTLTDYRKDLQMLNQIN